MIGARISDDACFNVNEQREGEEVEVATLQNDDTEIKKGNDKNNNERNELNELLHVRSLRRKKGVLKKSPFHLKS